jgi:hypothetical protein
MSGAVELYLFSTPICLCEMEKGNSYLLFIMRSMSDQLLLLCFYVLCHFQYMTSKHFCSVAICYL